MLADTSKQSASHMKDVYQDDFLVTYGLGTTDVLVQKRAGMLSAGAGAWVRFNIFIVRFVKTASADLARSATVSF